MKYLEVLIKTSSYSDPKIVVIRTWEGKIIIKGNIISYDDNNNHGEVLSVLREFDDNE